MFPTSELEPDIHQAETHASAYRARQIISRNNSPDIPFTYSINPYLGCEHGCIYCYARPSHSYLNLSPGLDFERRLFYKPNAAALLKTELSAPGYRCKPITLGANTDPYQPIERKYGITRQLLEVMWSYRQPVVIITKSRLITRDLDVLGDMGRAGLVHVMVSLTSLVPAIKRTLEPRAASPQSRLNTIDMLARTGISTGVLIAPVIPLINDSEIETLLERAVAAGATRAAYILLRLPHEVAALFREWLDIHYPLRANHVMSLVRQARGGKDYDARFGLRMRGTGEYASLLGQRFKLACNRAGISPGRVHELDTTLFRPGAENGEQFSLF